MSLIREFSTWYQQQLMLYDILITRLSSWFGIHGSVLNWFIQQGRTCSSSLITIARPPSSSSLKITDRSFRYTSPSLWNKLSASFHQPRSSSVTTGTITPSITYSIFHSRYLFTNPSHHRSCPIHRTAHWTPTGLPSRTLYCSAFWVECN